MVDLKSIKAVLLDADGTFFNGQETRKLRDGEIAISKERSLQDGQGLSLLRALGIRILFVSGEGEPLDSIIEKLNKLPSVKSGKWHAIDLVTRVSGQDKVESIKAWLKESNIEWRECIYMGDDINDLKAMSRIKQEGGVVFAPANATRKVKEMADVITMADGGRGAIREMTEIVLDSKGINESTLDLV